VRSLTIQNAGNEMSSNLKPGASYIYEHVNGITYARESGAPFSSRVEIGRSYERIKWEEELEDRQLWNKIRLASEKNPALREAMEKCKMLYYLIENKNEI